MRGHSARRAALRKATDEKVSTRSCRVAESLETLGGDGQARRFQLPAGSTLDPILAKDAGESRSKSHHCRSVMSALGATE
jgi:hypothetical protein